MRRNAPSSSTCPMNSRRSSYLVTVVREVQRLVDHGRRALEVVVAEHVHLHDEGSAAVELLVLLVPAAELGADEIPGEAEQPQGLARRGRSRAEGALDVLRRLRVVEVGARGGQSD